MNRFYSMENLYSAPAGVLTAYDLADLAACLAPNPVLMLNPVDQGSQPTSFRQAGDAYAFARTAYRRRNADDALRIETNLDVREIEAVIEGWLD
jgi:hypothetical protein